MNLRKHLAGLALFSAILGTAIFINYYLTLPDPTIPPVQVFTADLVWAEASPQLIDYKVRQVSLDFVNRASYTTLTLKLLPNDQPAPEKIWVTTVFFSPDVAGGGGWSYTTEVARPFGKGDQIELVTSEPLEIEAPLGTPRAAYFAHVYVSAGRADESFPSAVLPACDLTDAIPVVVQWPDGKRHSAGTAERVVRGTYLIY